MNEKKKVFISHATEDKDRFVINFAKYLVSRGVSVWLDKWELLPGDSLIDKIFEEGLKNSDVVIVVISKYSIKKTWVHEELNAALIKKIENKCKLIPVIIDELDHDEFPIAIKNIFWIKIDSLNKFEESAELVISAILNKRKILEVGVKPKYYNLYTDTFDEQLTNMDILIFKLICSVAMTTSSMFIQSADIVSEINKIEIPAAEFEESIEVLNAQNYIEVSRDSEGLSHIIITTIGLHKYALNNISEYHQMIFTVANLLLNDDEMDTNVKIAAEIEKPIILIDNILNLFNIKGLIKTITDSEGIFVYYINPVLKRKIENLWNILQC